MVLTDQELALLLNSLKESEDSLTRYVEWVNDRPMLPTTEVAIGRVREEKAAMLSLRLRIYEEQSKRISERAKSP